MHLLKRLLGSQSSNGQAPLSLSAAEYKERFYRTNVAHTLVDVRTREEYADGHLAMARNIPLQELEERMDEISQGQPVALYCRSGNRSGMAARMLHEAGYSDVYNIGGLNALAAHGLPMDALAKR